MSQLFPDIKFILVDPNKFDILLNDDYKLESHRNVKHKDIIHINYITQYNCNANIYTNNKKITIMTKSEQNKTIEFIKSSNYKIYIIEDYMNNIYATLFKKLNNVVFISDIRSNVLIDGGPTDFDIIWNTSMMYNWLYILQPEMSMVKFRMPYNNEKDKMLVNIPNEYIDEFTTSRINGIDFKKNYLSNKFMFYKSTLYIQAWPGRTSTELRGIILKDDIIKKNIINYDYHTIENKLFYYNIIVRSWFYIKNTNADKLLNFCHCNDCAIENVIWCNYFKLKIKQPAIKSVLDGVKSLDHITKKPLNRFHLSSVWKKWNFTKTKDIALFTELVTKVFPNRIAESILKDGNKYKYKQQKGK